MEVDKIYNESNLVTIGKMPDKFVSGIITSPPYNICSKRKDGYYNNGYSQIDNLTEEEYISVRLKEFVEFETTTGGTVAVARLGIFIGDAD